MICLENGDHIQLELSTKYQQRTVPMVFVGGKFIGGSDATHAARDNGSLAKMLKDAGLEPKNG